MSLLSTVSTKLALLNNTLCFFKNHLAKILGLGLMAALGRVIQLGGFGPIPAGMNIALEVVVESARLLLVLFVLGWGNIRGGALRIKHIWRKKDSRKKLWAAAIQKMKRQWLAIFLNMIAFLAIAWAINYLIDLLAYETCLYLTLKKDGILVETSSEWTILLFFKNLTVIPLTLIFDTILILWLSNRLTGNRKVILQGR